MASKYAAPSADKQLVCLLRHAERLDDVDINWLSSKNTRQYDPPLSPAGMAVASGLCEQLQLASLKFKHVVSSPFLRTLQTATPVARQVGCSELVVCSGLCEFLSEEVGILTAPEFQQEEQAESCPGITLNFMGDPSPTFPETLVEAKERYRQAIQMVADKYWPDNVLIITHAICVRSAFPMLSAPLLKGLIPYCGGILAERMGDKTNKLVYVCTLNDVDTWDVDSSKDGLSKHHL